MSISNILLYFPGGSGPTPTPTPTIPGGDALSLALYSLQATLKGTDPFGPSTVIVSLFPEPYPTAGSPLCFLTPGEFREIEGQNTGGGRYVSGFKGIIFTHIVLRNIEDMSYRSEQFFMNQLEQNGIFKVVDSVVNAVQVEFLADLSTLNPGVLVTQEPIRLVDFSKAKLYDRAGQWGGIRLAWEIRVTLKLDVP